MPWSLLSDNKWEGKSHSAVAASRTTAQGGTLSAARPLPRRRAQVRKHLRAPSPGAGPVTCTAAPRPPRRGGGTHGVRAYVRVRALPWPSGTSRTRKGRCRVKSCGSAEPPSCSWGPARDGATVPPSPRPRGKARAASPRSARQLGWH